MDMTITKLSPTTLSALRGLARRNGKTLEEYARSVLERATDNFSRSDTDKTEWVRTFNEWMENLDPNIPSLTDEQISRESIYEEQILRQT